MIEFFSKTDFELPEEVQHADWIRRVIESEEKICGDITYTFCSDEQLDTYNQEYLNHTDYTDIISFDDGIGTLIAGSIFISIERVRENAEKFKTTFVEELHRVMVHGVLHYCGYKDKTEAESELMRRKEEEKMKMFHVEQ